MLTVKNCGPVSSGRARSHGVTADPAKVSDLSKMGLEFTKKQVGDLIEIKCAGTVIPYAQFFNPKAIMQEHSSMHAYLNWTKQRIDEMDAALASLEAKVSQLKANSKAKADHLLADLKERQHEFQAKAKVQAQAGEATLQASRRNWSRNGLASKRSSKPTSKPSASRSSSSKQRSGTWRPLK